MQSSASFHIHSRHTSSRNENLAFRARAVPAGPPLAMLMEVSPKVEGDAGPPPATTDTRVRTRKKRRREEGQADLYQHHHFGRDTGRHPGETITSRIKIALKNSCRQLFTIGISDSGGIDTVGQRRVSQCVSDHKI